MNINRKEIWFLAKFFAIFLALEFLIVAIDFSWLQFFIAGTQAQFLGLESSGKLVFTEKGTFEIVASCTGLVSASVLAAIIFSLKKPELKQKITIFLAGFLLLFALNYLRVLLVIWSGTAIGMGFAEALHVLSWFTTTIFIIGLWYWFTKKITGEKSFEGFM